MIIIRLWSIVGIISLPGGTDCARVEEDGGNELLLERVAFLGVVDKVARILRKSIRLVPMWRHKQARVIWLFVLYHGTLIYRAGLSEL